MSYDLNKLVKLSALQQLVQKLKKDLLPKASIEEYGRTLIINKDGKYILEPNNSLIPLLSFTLQDDIIVCDQTEEEIYEAITRYNNLVNINLHWAEQNISLSTQYVLNLPNVNVTISNLGTTTTFNIYAEGYLPIKDSENKSCWRRYVIKLICNKKLVGSDFKISTSIELDNDEILYPYHSDIK